MRLLAEEQKEIMKLMDRYDLDGQYELVKRKGWVYVNIKGCSFAFHRKKTTEIVNGKFENKLQYFVRVDNSMQPFEHLSQVIEKLDQWVQAL